MIGCDIVCISAFAQKISQTPSLLDRLFTQQEIIDAQGVVASLAGKFAAKEAACKALGIPAGSWHDIIITKASAGKPVLVVAEHQQKQLSLSISHDGDYAMAVVLVHS